MLNEVKESKGKMTRVSEIMTRHLHTLTLEDSLSEARRKFEDLHVRHLPVVDGNNLIGILSLTDILRMSFGDKFGNSQIEADEAIFEMLTIDQVMKHHPKTIDTSHTVEQVAEILASEEFHALPVVDGEELIGIVTTTDVIRFLLDR